MLLERRATAYEQQLKALVEASPAMARRHGAMIKIKGVATRTALYMAVWSASQYHPKLSVFYKRLRESGKSTKVAFCAVARKLLIQINSALKPIAAQQ